MAIMVVDNRHGSNRRSNNTSSKKNSLFCALFATSVFLSAWNLLRMTGTGGVLIAFYKTQALINDNGLFATNKNKNKNTMHVLLALSGKHVGFFREVDVLLKSLLLNAPDDPTSSLEIHIVADGPAYAMLEQLLYSDNDTEGNNQKQQQQQQNNKGSFSTNLHRWRSKNPVVVRTYNCQPLIPRWEEKIRELYRRGGMDSESTNYDLEFHTIGAWFRLFVHEVIPLLKNDDDTPDATIENILFMDSDVVLLANLQDLWNQYDHAPADDSDSLPTSSSTSSSSSRYYFQWGASQCSGFMVLNVPKVEEMWKIVDSYGLSKAQQHIADSTKGDQFFLRTFQLAQPDKVGWLPDRWDNNLADGMWKWRKNLVEQRPQIGYIHFNGGGKSQEAWFLKNDTDPTILYDNEWVTDRDTANTFGIVDYYIRLPWKWARYFAEAKIPKWSNGTLIEIHYNRSLS